MKGLGSYVGAFVCALVIVIINEIAEFDTIYFQQAEVAVSKCKDGKWEKIDQGTIYCKDGAEYVLEIRK